MRWAKALGESQHVSLSVRVAGLRLCEENEVGVRAGPRLSIEQRTWRKYAKGRRSLKEASFTQKVSRYKEKSLLVCVCMSEFVRCTHTSHRCIL